MKPSRAVWIAMVMLGGALAWVPSCGKDEPASPDVGGESGAGGSGSSAGGADERGRAGQVGRASAGTEWSAEAGRAGEDGTSALPSLPRFLEPGSAWQSAASLASCATRVAKAAADTWPPLSFEVEKPGLARARVVSSTRYARANTMGSGSRVEAGRLRITLALEFLTAPYRQAVVTHDLKSGQALVALVDDNCLVFTDGPGSPHVYTVTPKQGDPVMKRAWLDLAGESRLRWVSGSDDRLLRGFDTNHVWGGIENLSRVFVAESPLVTELTSVYEAQGVLRAPAGAENLAVWAESTKAGYRVVGWSPQTGTVPLADGQWGVAALGASSTRVVWAAGTGPRIGDGAYEGGSMRWCERGESLTPCEPQSGARLPITSSAPTLVTEGDVAAFSACVGDDCGVYVTNLSTGVLFRYDAGADHSLDVLGIDAEYLYVADHQGPDERGSVLFGSILRIELAALPSLAEKL